jgi:pimeloyl-ACP methyl ester carboxylesterase
MTRTGRWARPLRNLGLALALAALFASHAVAQTPRFEDGDCPFLVIAPEVEGETIACGRLIVPENRERPSGPTVSLQVAIVVSHASEPAAPIVYLEGGPGGSAVMNVPDVWTRSALRQHAHILVFDQRGTGYSTPSLDCPEFLDEGADDPLRACRDRLAAAGIDLAAFNSRESASDVADLLEVLEIETATLYGVSYGTRLALTVMRDHPERIVSAILDGVYPPHINGYEEQAWNGYLAFERLFDDCDADARCRAAYPDLRGTFLAMVDTLDAAPMLDDDGAAITSDDVVNDLFQLLYDTNALPHLPAVIAAAAARDIDGWFDAQDRIPADLSHDGSDAYWDALDARLLVLTGFDDLDDLDDYLDTLDDETYDALLAAAAGEVDGDAEGMFASVECHEEVPFNDLQRAVAWAQELPDQLRALIDGVTQQFADCVTWDVPAADAIENEPVASVIPTLLLSGAYDPVTPPSWGDAAAAYLLASTHVVFPDMGHATVDIRPCPTQIALAFLADPWSTPDASCVDDLGPPEFWVP